MCGLFGIINTQPQKFDKRAFLTLGINNDSRGGDACGVFIDGKVEYGVDKDKLFFNFYEKSELIKNATQCRVALGHCRKASVGGVASHKAQPCIIKNDKGEIEFVVTHNGTIKNYEDLAAKYIPDINIKDLTDSQVMTLIFYHKGYDVLTEYVGTAAFIIADYRHNNPKVYLFHGRSLATKYVEKTSEERPLYLVSNKNTTVYSSIPDYLYSLFYEDEVLVLGYNALISIDHKGKLYIVKEYDRDKCLQQDYGTTKTVVVPYRHDAYGYGANDDDYDDYYGYRRNNGSKSQGGEVAKNTNTNAGNRLRMDDDFHILNSNAIKAHGQYLVDVNGNIVTLKDLETVENVRTIYVYNGIIVNNKDAFDALMKIANAWCCTPAEVCSIMPKLPYSLSPYPSKNYDLNKSWLAHVFVEGSEKPVLFTGTVPILFTENIYVFDKGIKYVRAIKSDIKNSFVLIDSVKDCEVPTQIIIDYLNDFI